MDLELGEIVALLFQALAAAFGAIAGALIGGVEDGPESPDDAGRHQAVARTSAKGVLVVNGLLGLLLLSGPRPYPWFPRYVTGYVLSTIATAGAAVFGAKMGSRIHPVVAVLVAGLLAGVAMPVAMLLLGPSR